MKDVKLLYPDQKLASNVEDKDLPLFHFNGVEIDDEDAGEHFQISLGDSIELVGEDIIELVDNKERETVNPMMRVVELYETPSGDRYVRGHYYYRLIETIMGLPTKHGDHVRQRCLDYSNDKGLHEKRVWLATVEDNETYHVVFPIDSVHRKVNVKHVQPGSPCPQDCDFWYDQTHTKYFYTFADVYRDTTMFGPHWKDPRTLDTDVMELDQENLLDDEGNDTPKKRTLHVLDLFCGAGGLSFICQKNDNITIESRWAVDIEASAAASYAVNHPQARSYCMGLDEFLVLCKKWDKLSRKFSDAYKTPKRVKAGKKAFTVLDVSLRAIADRVKHNCNAGQLRVDTELNNKNIWMVFKIKIGDGQAQWVRFKQLKTLPDYKAVLGEFIRKYNKKGCIPRPGDVDVVTGGPPCQGVSGLNRHAKHSDVLNDPKNRLLKAYFDLVEYFKPSYILMEQVQDIFKKEHGAYARTAAALFLNNGYQVRCGLMAAGSFGVAQGRYRVFMWGALSGQEQLPPLPKPSHKVKQFNQGLSKYARECHVKLEPEEEAEAYEMVLMGDVLSDLPDVHNYTFSEYLEYKTPPQCPHQVFLRRDPPQGQISRAQRADRAQLLIQKTVDSTMERMECMIKHEEDVAKKAKKLYDPVAIGKLFYCQKKGNKNFANQVYQQLLQEVKEKDGEQGKDAVLALLCGNYRGFASLLGMQVTDEVKQGRRQKGHLRDHRPLMCNADDYIRMCNVPKTELANFRAMPGVVTNRDGTCCTGHSHAFRLVDHETGKRWCGCAGGGVIDLPERSRAKTSRVDHFDKEGTRIINLEGCPGRTFFLPSSDHVCPRWCITYKNGKSDGRHGCFGRIQPEDVQPTVVGRAEPHNLKVVHPKQDRVLTVRENARCQGFPDYWALVGKCSASKGYSKHFWGATARYLQMGNAVAPPVASALGRCLVLAAGKEAPDRVPVVCVPDPELIMAEEEARCQGLVGYAKACPEKLVKDGRSITMRWLGQKMLNQQGKEIEENENNNDEDDEDDSEENLPDEEEEDQEDSEEVKVLKPSNKSNTSTNKGKSAVKRRHEGHPASAAKKARS